MTDDTLLPFAFPAVSRKKVTAAFDEGRASSDGGVMLLAEADRRLGLADKLAAGIADPRDPLRITHTLADILRARILAIACGWEDADDLDHLRRLVRRIRRHWPTTRLTLRGDSHYGRPEIMDWCDAVGIDYVFGLQGNTVLTAAVEIAADDIRTRRALTNDPGLRGYTETHALAKAEFATVRLRLLKIGTRVIETASRVRLAFAAACPHAALIRHIATALLPSGP
jgi:hypothetical protein